MTNIKAWLKKILCEHHWHTDPDSYRKVKSDSAPLCERWSKQQKTYIRPGVLGFHEIVVKSVRSCCLCGKKEIHTQYEEATIQARREVALHYPDIDGGYDEV